MPKQGHCVIIFYDEKDNVSNLEVETTEYGRNLTLRHKIGVEKRNFKVYRLGSLLAKCVRDPESGPTPVAADKKACRADHAKLQAMRLAPKYCPECGEQLSCR